MSVEDLHPSADAFRHRALGKGGFRVLSALAAIVAPTTSELSETLPGMSDTTLRKTLRRLEAQGLASRGSDGRWRAVRGDLGKVAERLGTAGKGEEQRAIHAAQRHLYRERRLSSWNK